MNGDRAVYTNETFCKMSNDAAVSMEPERHVKTQQYGGRAQDNVLLRSRTMKYLQTGVLQSGPNHPLTQVHVSGAEQVPVARTECRHMRHLELAYAQVTSAACALDASHLISCVRTLAGSASKSTFIGANRLTPINSDCHLHCGMSGHREQLYSLLLSSQAHRHMCSGPHRSDAAHMQMNRLEMRSLSLSSLQRMRSRLCHRPTTASSTYTRNKVHEAQDWKLYRAPVYSTCQKLCIATAGRMMHRPRKVRHAITL